MVSKINKIKNKFDKDLYYCTYISKNSPDYKQYFIDNMVESIHDKEHPTIKEVNFNEKYHKRLSLSYTKMSYLVLIARGYVEADDFTKRFCNGDNPELIISEADYFEYI